MLKQLALKRAMVFQAEGTPEGCEKDDIDTGFIFSWTYLKLFKINKLSIMVSLRLREFWREQETA